ncbi:MAG: hypothetical protein AAF597_09225, partial [Bacteroidota bacterium]
SGSIAETQAKVDEWFQNTSVWVKTKQWLDGPVMVTFLLREALTGGKIVPTGSPAKLTVTNLGGTFYGKTDVLRIEGLYPKDALVGYVNTEGYRQTRFEFTVPEVVPEGGKLPPVEIRMPEVAVRPMKVRNSPSALGSASPPKQRGGGSKKRSKTKSSRSWLVPAAGLLGLLVILLAVGIAWFGTGADLGETEFTPTIQEQQPDRRRTEDAEVVGRQDLTRELIAFANAVELFQTQQYDAKLSLFGPGNRLAFSTPEQRDVMRARIVAMQAAAKSDYRVRATTSRAAGMRELGALLTDDRLTSSQRAFLQRRYSGYQKTDDAQAVAKEAFSNKLREEVNAAKLYPLSLYLRRLAQIDKNEAFSVKEKKVLRLRLEVMQRVAKIKRDEEKGVFPPDNPLAKLARNKNLTKAQRDFVRRLAE